MNKEENGITIKQLESVLEKFNNKNQKDLKQTEDWFTVMLEDVRGDIQVVAEGVSIVQKELSEFKDEMIGFKQETENNFQVIFDWQSNFSDGFDDEVVSIRKELDEIKEELAKRPTGEAFGILEKRIFNLENRFDKIEKVKA